MEEERDLVVFQDDEGNEITMEVLDYFFYEGKEYGILTEDIGDDAQDEEEIDPRECYIMEIVPVGEDEEEFVPVPEDLAEKLIELVESGAFADDEEFEDDEEE